MRQETALEPTVKVVLTIRSSSPLRNCQKNNNASVGYGTYNTAGEWYIVDIDCDTFHPGLPVVCRHSAISARVEHLNSKAAASASDQHMA